MCPVCPACVGVCILIAPRLTGVNSFTRSGGPRQSPFYSLSFARQNRYPSRSGGLLLKPSVHPDDAHGVTWMARVCSGGCQKSLALAGMEDARETRVRDGPLEVVTLHVVMDTPRRSANSPSRTHASGRRSESFPQLVGRGAAPRAAPAAVRCAGCNPASTLSSLPIANASATQRRSKGVTLGAGALVRLKWIQSGSALRSTGSCAVQMGTVPLELPLQVPRVRARSRAARRSIYSPCLMMLVAVVVARRCTPNCSPESLCHIGIGQHACLKRLSDPRSSICH